MAVKITNRSHRIAYMVVLLALAVALTTALVLAGQRSVTDQQKNVFQQDLHSTCSAVLKNGYSGCAAA
jgi:hypothetical protein